MRNPLHNLIELICSNKDENLEAAKHLLIGQISQHYAGKGTWSNKPSEIMVACEVFGIVLATRVLDIKIDVTYLMRSGKYKVCAVWPNGWQVWRNHALDASSQIENAITHIAMIPAGMRYDRICRLINETQWLWVNEFNREAFEGGQFGGPIRFRATDL